MFLTHNLVFSVYYKIKYMICSSGYEGVASIRLTFLLSATIKQMFEGNKGKSRQAGLDRSKFQ